MWNGEITRESERAPPLSSCSSAAMSLPDMEAPVAGPPAEPTEQDPLTGSGDYTKYGITNVPHYTTTTAIGKTRTFAGLYLREWAFVIVSTLNIMAAVGLTVARLVMVLEKEPSSPDFTFTILLLLNEAFCCFYVIHGVLRERKYELYALMAAITVLLVYCIVEYAFLNISGRNTLKLVRLILICVLAPINIYLTWSVSRSFGYLEFRIVGASQFLQNLYRQAAVFSCLLKFDVQITGSFVILALTEGTTMALAEKISIGVGVPFSVLWAVMGWVAMRKEIRWLAVMFGVVGFTKPSYYLYRIIVAYGDLESGTNNFIVYSLLSFGALGLIVWFVLTVELIVVYRNFGQGLKERAFDTKNSGILAWMSSRWRSN